MEMANTIFLLWTIAVVALVVFMWLPSRRRTPSNPANKAVTRRRRGKRDGDASGYESWSSQASALRPIVRGRIDCCDGRFFELIAGLRCALARSHT